MVINANSILNFIHFLIHELDDLVLNPLIAQSVDPILHLTRLVCIKSVEQHAIQH